ncbi:MAG: acetyl-CoA carboxylase carboxyltransferase subunit beta [Candidatus Hydrogenedentes bacterium]|nr:acetyl-CoA carboxylase carboxyltransferase subunit beta [Candidatus Hydrogenedentota bacterium]
MPLFHRKKVTGAGGAKSEMPEGLWLKCEACQETVYRSDLEANLSVCPLCGHHYRVGARARITLLLDADSFGETWAGLQSGDPLAFSAGAETYAGRLARARESSGLGEAIVTGRGAIGGIPVAVGAMDPAFMMGSMGSAVGEKFCRLVRDAVGGRLPLLVFTASGGARMQEGILALMQMAKTACAVRDLHTAGVPYIAVLTDPTTGGVYASFASLADITLAEPGACIGFAGKRLIEGALRVALPEGFQTAESQFENGFLDAVVKRTEMREYLARLLRCLAPGTAPAGHVAAPA